MPDAPATPAPAAAAGAPQRGPPQAQAESPMKKLFAIAQQVILIYLITQAVLKYAAPKKAAPPAVEPGSIPEGAPVDAAGNVSPFFLPPKEAHQHPSWPSGMTMSMHVHLSTSPIGDVFSKQWTSGYRKNPDAGLPAFVWENITLGDWKDSRVEQYDVKLPESVQRNASLWADVFLVKDGASPDPANPKFDPAAVHHVRKLLTPYMAKAKVRKVKNLLSKSDENAEEAPEPADVIVSHWHPNITLALISDSPIVPYDKLHPAAAEHVHLVPNARGPTGIVGFYKPIIYPNDFWHLREQYTEINTTTPTLPLQITFQPMSFMKFQMFSSMTVGFNEAAKKQGGNSGAELDEIKRMLTDTNPYFLALTAAVSILHMVFEMLAFKNDVSHWRTKKELVGVSVRTIITNVFVQIVILLYLLDNNKDTSWMIIMSSGMGVLIEAWKITKAMDIKLVPAPPGSTFPYKLDIKDKHVLSEDEKKTQEYDKLAFRYVSYVTIPLLACYTVYSLVYETHRGWYSFVISTLTSFVYMFGFAQLVPQLIINCKLKSVAHMPMKAMVYKTLSTVVDDFFAFCIKMPILHRLACFRDDVVFLIFLYQRWIYRIDPNRVNEYGQVMATDADSANKLADKAKDKADVVEVESKKNR